ncbi:MAG TPA: M23 family metallopeptidase, partial [Ramlibacter sp.]|nr:M23 family metallopeptidase [Ramlibacter sp.]
AAGLQGCSREPVRTEVVTPQHPLPENAPLRPQAGGPPPAVALAPAPQAAPQAAAPPSAPQATTPASAPQLSARAPASAVATPLPDVANPGDREGARLLAQRTLQVPVVGVLPTVLTDMYEQGRGGRTHEAIDIAAPTGTPVVAVDDGRIVKLFDSKPGGLTIYQFDPNKQLSYYYAHLQRYADNITEGMTVRRGDVIGYVGSTGNADPNVPHLHFGVFRLDAKANWWEGEPVNPYPALRAAAPSTQVTAGR